MLRITATDNWRTYHTGATIGLLEISGVDNSHRSQVLDRRKRETETFLREQYKNFTRQDFLALPVISAYTEYYKQFNKTYHVLLQLESIVLKQKNLPTISPAVDSNFMAEVETLVLTAAHDINKLRRTICFDTSKENDQMPLMSGKIKTIRAGDMIMKDDGGICCSIIYGQDNRSPVSSATSNILYVAYAPIGVPTELVDMQLQKILEHVHLFSPDITAEKQFFQSV